MPLRAHRVATLTAIAAVAAVPAAGAKPKPPPKPPKPEITLLTETEQGVLRRGKIKLLVEAKRAKKVTVTGDFVVDGYPDDFAFDLGPKRKSIDDGDAKVQFPLSSRQKEVLDFAIKSCRGATVAVRAKTEKRTATLDAALKLPGDCAAGRS
jgi:hypothetical protein